MHGLRHEFSIKDLCRVLRVGRSTYYKHFNGKESPRTVENRTIMGFMLRLYGSHSKRIGVHKTKHLLEREYGIRISIGRVYRLMKRMDLPRPSTSKPKASKSKADDKGECLDRVNRNFSVDEPDRIWCSDFTYIWTDGGWAFPCVVIDLFSRKVVSWSLMKRHTCALVCEAFRKAFWRRGAPKRAHVPLGQGRRVLVKRIQEASGFMFGCAVVLGTGMSIRQLGVRELLQIPQEGGDRQIPIQDVRAAQGLDARLHRRILQFEEAPFIDRIHDPEREGCLLLQERMILLLFVCPLY